jgi:hypothetical protein
VPLQTELSRDLPLESGGEVHVRFTGVTQGDLRIDGPAEELAVRRERLVAGSWSWLRQVHGAQVVVVDHPGQHAGVEADAAITDQPGVVLAIHTADCAPVALIGSHGAVGAVHAGWRGLDAGVIEAAFDGLRRLGETEVQAIVGPCIHAECYEFGSHELDGLARRYGEDVRGRTTAGTPALDLPAAVTTALHRAGVDQVDLVPTCTACDQAFFSHRARGNPGRQALVVWVDGP